LVHHPDRKPALKRRIRLRMAKRCPARRQSAAMGFNALDPTAQSRKRARACARHASPASFNPDAGRLWLLESRGLGLFVHDMFLYKVVKPYSHTNLGRLP